MRRKIQNVAFNHEDTRSEMTLEVTLEGTTETYLYVEYTKVGDDEFSTVTDAFGNDGLEALMGNEKMSRVEALAELAGVMSDLENADRMNRRARQGLSTYVLTEMAKGAR